MRFNGSVICVSVLLLVFILLSEETKAQFGFKAGVSSSNFVYTDREMDPDLSFDIDLRPYLGYDIEWVQLGEQGPLISPYLGAYFNYQFGKRFVLRPELSFVQKGVRYDQREYEDITYRVKITYLEIPVSVALQYIKKENFISELYFGGYGSLKLKAVKKVGYHNSEITTTKLNAVNTFDAGILLGLDFKRRISQGFLVLDVRMFYGLTNVFHMPDDETAIYYSTQKTKITGIYLTLGYEF